MARARLRLLAMAQDDLIAARRYSRREFGVNAADRLIDDLNRVFSLLQENPAAGAEVSRSLPGIRSFSKRGHRIFYRIDGETIVIQRILHHSRDAQHHLAP